MCPGGQTTRPTKCHGEVNTEPGKKESLVAAVKREVKYLRWLLLLAAAATGCALAFIYKTPRLWK